LRKYCFAKNKRLLKNGQFKSVLSDSLHIKNSLLRLWARPNKLKTSRLGVSIKKNRITAVTRNRFKRLIREAYRQIQYQIPPGYDFVVMPSSQWLEQAKGHNEKKQALRKFTLSEVKISLLNLVDKTVKKHPSSHR